MIYKRISTNYDVMKELYIRGAEITDLGFAVLDPVFTVPKFSVDFSERKKIKAADFRNSNINFYLHDSKIGGVWADADKYLDGFRHLHSICGLDYTIDERMPLAMQMWNKYRNHALSYYYSSQGVPVIPNVNILTDAASFIYEGLPVGSVLACSTNGRTKRPEDRIDFCKGFNQMVERLKPIHVMIIGRTMPELETDVPITYYDTQSMKRYETRKKARDISDGNLCYKYAGASSEAESITSEEES